MNLSAALGEGGSPNIPSPEHAALIVIDMQNAYCHRDGFVARNAMDPGACERVVVPCTRAVAVARRASVPVLHAVKVSYSASMPTVSFHNAQRTGPGLMLSGDWEAAIVEPLCPAPGELVLEKIAYSAFYGTALDAIVQQLQVRKLVIVGVTTSICVESTARDAAQRRLDVYVASDATAEWETSRHEHALEQMRYAFARLVTVDQLVAAWATR